MAMRHLVTGQNNCAPDGASSSNPFGALANALLGQSSKAQVQRMSSSKINDHLHGVPISFVGALLMIGLNLFDLQGFLNLEGQRHALQNLSKFIIMLAQHLDHPWMVHHKGSYLVSCILSLQVDELVCHFNLFQYQPLVCLKVTNSVFVIVAA